MKTGGRLIRTEQFGKGLSDSMVRGLHAACRSALEKAVQEDLIRTNPAVGCKLPPKRGREMQVLGREELQRFLIQAQAEGYFELFLLDLCTGLRRGELLALRGGGAAAVSGRRWTPGGCSPRRSKRMYPDAGRGAPTAPDHSGAGRV